MAGHGILDLRAPPLRFNPSGTSGFETGDQAAAEDKFRARTLRVRALADPSRADELSDLADRIDPSVTDLPDTLASSRHSRSNRVKLAGSLWQVTEQDPIGARLFDLLPGDRRVARTALAQTDPIEVMRRLRTDLYRSGAADADGFLFAGLHGEHDAADDAYDLHFHGVASGEMLDVVGRLSQRRRYRADRGNKGGTEAWTPVRIQRSPMTDLPRPLTYITQSWWPAAPFATGGDSGNIGNKPSRGGTRRRMPEPAHSEWLLWLDRQSLADLTLMIHLRVIEGKLATR
jgi:hypothetical protein